MNGTLGDSQAAINKSMTVEFNGSMVRVVDRQTPSWFSQSDSIFKRSAIVFVMLISKRES